MTDPTLQMLAYELAAIFAVLCVWLILRANKKKKQANEAASKAVKRLKRAKDRRVNALSETLTEKYGLSAEALNQTVTEIQDREQQIYKVLLTLFVDQDNKSLTVFPEQLEQAIDACLNLLPVGRTINADDAEDLSEKIAEMSLKIDQLIIEAKQTDDQLNAPTEVSADEIGNDEKVLIESTSEEPNVDAEIKTGELSEELGDIDVSEEGFTIESTDNNSVDESISGDNDTEEQSEQSDNTETEDVAEVVETIEDAVDEILSPESSTDVTDDDVDALLADLDMDLPEQDLTEGIDLSSIDEDDSDEEINVKKPNAESVDTPADSASSDLKEISAPETVAASDDIDDLLASVEAAEEPTEDVEEEVDIDQLLAEQSAPETVAASDDIDDLLASVEVAEEPTEQVEEEVDIDQLLAEQSAPETVSASDDIDDLLASVEVAEKPTEQVEEEVDIDQLLAEQSEPETVTASDDIDDLLASVEVDEEPTEQVEEEVDIDQLLAGQSEPETVAASDDIDQLLAEQSEVETDEESEDVDDLLDSLETTDVSIRENGVSDIEADLLDSQEISEEEPEEILPSNKMSDYLNSGWDSIVPDVYNKTDVAHPVEVEAELDVKSEEVAGEDKPFITEEEQLTALMTNVQEDEGNDEIKADAELASNEVQQPETNEVEPVSELDSLRSKVRERTQQLKAEQEAKKRELEQESIVDDLPVLDSSEQENSTVDDVDVVEAEMSIEPLPSENELDNMLSEIRELEQEDTLAGKPEELVEPQSSEAELKAILSSIPSFSQMNKK